MVDTKELLRSVDLAVLLTQLSGEPTGTGSKRRWHCVDPAHHDEHPSVSMRIDNQGVERWKCWSDGQSGTAIDALMVARSIDVSTAIKELQERHPVRAAPPRVKPRAVLRYQSTSKTMREWVERSHEALQRQVWSGKSEPVLDWLRARQITDVMIEANQLGITNNRSAATARDSGMPRGVGVVVPAYDRHGDLIAAQIRLLRPVGNMKYIMPGTPQRAMPAVSFPRGGHGDVLVVTEGIFDGIAVNQAGFRSAALPSTAVDMDAAAALIADTGFSQVVIALDGDQAGKRATIGLRNALRNHGVNPALLKVPEGEDLNSLYRKAPAQWQATAKSATRSIV